uniref:Uncharacterized protein n=1 Tax=Arundo donax TaxID=35708 RepID=A0A0A9BRA2_ARUDO
MDPPHSPGLPSSETIVAFSNTPFIGISPWKLL